MGEGVDGRTARHAHRRPELLEAGAEQLLAGGLVRLSMRPFAQAIGVSHATLLHHFHTKEQLLRELVDLLAQQELDYWATLVEERDLSALARRVWLRYTSERGQQMFRLMFEAVGLASRDEAFYGPLAEQMASPWLAPLEAVVGAVAPTAEDPAVLATLILGQFRGLLLDLLATGDRARVDAAFEAWLRDVESAW